MKKNLIIIFGILLLISAFFGVYQLAQILLVQGTNGVITFNGAIFLIEIIISGWVGIYLVKNKEEIYQKLNTPAGPVFKKSLSPWIIVYAVVIVGFIVASEFMK